MNARRLMVGLAIGLVGHGALADEPPKSAPPPKPGAAEIVDLGGDRYRIGAIVVDKAAKYFEVPAALAHVTETLEYIAVSRGGVKEYESLLVMEASPIQFQVASILIGMDDEESVKSRYQFDTRAVEGAPLRITLSWDDKGERKELSASDSLLLDGKPVAANDWVYTGSFTEPDGRFAAQSVGTLISFVHDPLAIIDHAGGLGIGEYGAITGNPLRLPPVGAPVTVRISAIDEERVGRIDEKE